MNTEILSSYVIFKVALTINLISVIWNIINDCDETYNYWEPLHFLIYGNGFQTWEYSPTYGLRSYLYLIICGWPALLLNWFFNSISKRFLFYIIRIYMAMITTFLEIHLFNSLKLRIKDNKKSILPVYCLFMLMFSAGSFISSTAFLPSSFAFYCSLLTFSYWLRRDYNITIASVAMSAIIGWPFSGAIGIPFAIDIIFYQRKLLYFFKMSFFWGLLLTISSIFVDSIFYGRLIFPSLNIIKYNVFNIHGSELYGVESIMFYIKNYFLNFNLSIILVVMFPFLLCYFFYKCKITSEFIIGLMAFSVFFVWNTIFFLQSHKEERFLFPSYPFLGVISGVCLYKLQQLFNEVLSYFKINWKFVKILPENSFGVIFFLVFGIINLSRIVAIILSYHSPVSIYSHINDITDINNKIICVGREWHRFPSHFLIGSDSVNISFIKSDFQGQLPAKFQSINEIAASRIIHNHFNDLNKEEINRYVDISECHFIIDRIDNQTKSINEPDWLNLNTNNKWSIVLQYKMLNPHSLGGGFSIFRSFYVPILFEKFNSFIDYAVLKKTT